LPYRRMTLVTSKHERHVFHHVSTSNLLNVSKTSSLIIEFALNIQPI
jgi:hypothetical protein